jgi:hypothetical protein
MLSIIWQKFSRDGQTCKRCRDTHRQLEKALSTIERILGPMAIETRLKVRQLTQAEFEENPAESNRIWVGGMPIEQWLNATVSDSSCCSVCGTLPCRTVEVDGTVFETLPERLIVEAALLAASDSLFDWFSPARTSTSTSKSATPSRAA